jgi:hypothetical protein
VEIAQVNEWRTVAVDEHTASLTDRLVDEVFGAADRVVSLQGRGCEQTVAAPREQPDQVLFFVILNIQRHIFKALGKAGSHRERLLRIADAHTVDRTHA